MGQIISGLLMLFEQPFRLGDWIETPTARGRVVEVNWRAVHIDTGTGLQITPNSVLAGASFTNLSRPPGRTRSRSPPCSRSTIRRTGCARCSRGSPAASAAQARRHAEVGSRRRHGIPHQHPLKSPADDGGARATFLRWVWYASRREGLHLDEAEDDFCTPEFVEAALRTVVPDAAAEPDDQQHLVPHATVVRYGADEIIQHVGDVPAQMTFIVSGRVRVDRDDRRRFADDGHHARRGVVPRADRADPATGSGRRAGPGGGHRATNRSRGHRRARLRSRCCFRRSAAHRGAAGQRQRAMAAVAE